MPSKHNRSDGGGRGDGSDGSGGGAGRAPDAGRATAGGGHASKQRAVVTLFPFGAFRSATVFFCPHRVTGCGAGADGVTGGYSQARRGVSRAGAYARARA